MGCSYVSFRYCPFGMEMFGRKYHVGGGSYRYGFNGQEKSTEIAEGLTTAEFWEYDSRTGRRWNVDLKPDASSSVYSTFGNNPILNMDPLGDTLKPFTFTYLPVTGNTEGRDPIASGVENVFRFAYNNTIGAFAGLGAGAWNTVTNQSSNANTNIMYEVDKFQKEAYDYHTTTPIGQQIKDLGNVATDLHTYDLPAQLLIAHTVSVSLAGFKQPGLSYTGTLLKVESEVTTTPSGLGNPFKNSSLSEIDNALQKHVQRGKLVEKPAAPGSKVYQNTKSKYSYNLDPGGIYKKGIEKPHIDVNYPNPKPKNVPNKKKLATKE